MKSACPTHCYICLDNSVLPGSTRPLPQPTLINHMLRLGHIPENSLYRKQSRHQFMEWSNAENVFISWRHHDLCHWAQRYIRYNRNFFSYTSVFKVDPPLVSFWCCGRKILLTHWCRVTHICVGTNTNIGSDNGLSPGRRQAIIWTNAGILLSGPFGANFSGIVSEIHTFSFKKMHFKTSFAK